MSGLNAILRISVNFENFKPVEFYSLDEITRVEDRLSLAKKDDDFVVIFKKAPRCFQLSAGKIGSLNFEPERGALQVNFSKTFDPRIMVVNFIDDIKDTPGVTDADIGRLVGKGPYKRKLDSPSTVSIGPWKEGVIFIEMFKMKDLFNGAVIES